MNNDTTVSAELGLWLVVSEQTVVPLIGSLYYSGDDPYAIRIAFHVGTDEPIEWTFARDLVAGGLTSRQGAGDIQVWPSSGTALDVAAGAFTDDDAAAGHQILNIEMSAPTGHARFEAPAAAMAEFLQRTYGIVPDGEESGHIDFEAELDHLLRQA
jgi:hypothetical protein